MSVGITLNPKPADKQYLDSPSAILAEVLY
jgi:hypothetical protein